MRRITVIDEYKTTKKANVLDEIQYSDLFAYKQDIQDWINARQFAISRTLPDWTDYIRVCNDIYTDAHVTSIITSIKNKIKLKDFVICDVNNQINEQKTDLLKKEWFYKFLDYTIESIFFPYSLIFLGDMYNYDLDIKLVDREYVTPQYDLIKKSLYISNNSLNAGWKYTDPKLRPYYIYVPSDRQLGLLDVAAPHVLGKKQMLIYWWRYAEKFGIPFAKGKTDIRDNQRRSNMDNMLSNMGNSPYAVLDLEDDVEFVVASNTDVYKMFKEELNYSNNEISKAFAGAIGVLDEKSFVGSAEAGERLLEEYIQAYSIKCDNIINSELMPRLIYTYHFPFSDTDYFKFVHKDKITFNQKLEAVKILLPYYKMTVEEIHEEFGISVEEKEMDANKNKNTNSNDNNDIDHNNTTDSVMMEVHNIYSNLIPVNPLPTKTGSEDEQAFISRCMTELNSEFPDDKQRYAVCKQQYNK
jgi:hypothetical protein